MCWSKFSLKEGFKHTHVHTHTDQAVWAPSKSCDYQPESRCKVVYVSIESSGPRSSVAFQTMMPFIQQRMCLCMDVMSAEKVKGSKCVGRNMRWWSCVQEFKRFMGFCSSNSTKKKKKKVVCMLFLGMGCWCTTLVQTVISQQLLVWLPLNFVQIFIVPRGWTLST